MSGAGAEAVAGFEDIRLLFREAMAHLGAAANVVTSDGAGGRVGFSATAVCSVTDSPPTLLVCLNRAASVYDAVTRNGRLCVNTLAPRHEDLAQLFGGKTPQDERFARAHWTTDADGSPALEDALVSCDGRIVETTRSGSHDVLFVAVDRIRVNAHRAAALIYFGRQFHSIGQP